MPIRTPLFSTFSFSFFIGFLAIVVLLLLPITDNFLSVTKNFSVFFGTLILLVLFVIQAMRRRSFELVLSPFTVPLLVFGGTIAASTFFTNAYPVEGLLGMGGIYLATVLIVLAGSAVLSARQTHAFLVSFAVLATVVVFLSALELTGAGPSMLYNKLFGLSLPSGVLFNLTGSPLVAVQLCLLALIGIITHLVTTKSLSKIFAILAPILVLGVGLFAWSLLPGKVASPILPSFGASWSVMLDSLHSPRTALIGVGPASYGNAYLQFKPEWMNLTPSWNIHFIQGANTPLTMVTSVGFIGFAAWLWLVARIIKHIRTASPEATSISWMLGATILFQLLLPPNPVTLVIQAALLAVFISTQKQQYPVIKIKALETQVVRREATESSSANLPVATLLSGGISLLGLATLFFFTAQAYAAHLDMGAAEKALAKNDVVAAFTYQTRAVQKNQYLDQFRRSFATTNIIIAAAISNKADATEEEKAESGQLIQWAVREARSATLLDPGDTQNWIILAQIYSNLIGSVEGAEEQAIQAYSQAIAINPNDPELRIALGGIFTSQENHQQAAQLYAQAKALKPDYANAYFNYAISLKSLELYREALAEMQIVLSLVPENTDDYVTVTEEVAALEAIVAELPPLADPATQGEQSSPLTGGASEQAAPNVLDQNLEAPDSVINTPSQSSLNLPAESLITEESTPATDDQTQNDQVTTEPAP